MQSLSDAEPSAYGSCDMRAHEAHDEAGGLPRVFGVATLVEIRRCEVLGPVKRELAIPTKVARCLRQAGHLAGQGGRQAFLFSQ